MNILEKIDNYVVKGILNEKSDKDIEMIIKTMQNTINKKNKEIEKIEKKGDEDPSWGGGDLWLLNDQVEKLENAIEKLKAKSKK